MSHTAENNSRSINLTCDNSVCRVYISDNAARQFPAQITFFNTGIMFDFTQLAVIYSWLLHHVYKNHRQSLKQFLGIVINFGHIIQGKKLITCLLIKYNLHFITNLQESYLPKFSSYLQRIFCL